MMPDDRHPRISLVAGTPEVDALTNRRLAEPLVREGLVDQRDQAWLGSRNRERQAAGRATAAFQPHENIRA